MQPFQPVEAGRAVPIRVGWGRRGLTPLQECAKVLPEMENRQLLLFSPDRGPERYLNNSGPIILNTKILFASLSKLLNNISYGYSLVTAKPTILGPTLT